MVLMRRSFPWAMTGRVRCGGMRVLWSCTARVSSLSPIPLKPGFSLRRAISSSFQASKMQWTSMLSTSQRSSRVWLRRLQLYFYRCRAYLVNFSLKQNSLPSYTSYYRAATATGVDFSTPARNSWIAWLQTSCPMMNSYLPISS
jgi:hypothetical protein